jgi:hypothetical protein
MATESMVDVKRIEDVFKEAGGEFIKEEDVFHYGGYDNDDPIHLHTRVYTWRFLSCAVQIIREEYVPAPGAPNAKTEWVAARWGCRVYDHSKEKPLLSDINLTGAMEAIEAHLQKH